MVEVKNTSYKWGFVSGSRGMMDVDDDVNRHLGPESKWHPVYTRAHRKASWTCCGVVPPGRSTGSTLSAVAAKARYTDVRQDRIRGQAGDEIGCVDPKECQKYCKIDVSCSNTAYPKLVITLLPVGLKGLMIAVIMAALMSSLTSIFNSASTIFTLDIWLRIRKNAKEQELMIVGRVFIVILVVISILWIPIIQAANSGLLFDYMQSVTSYLAPPVTAIFILGIFIKRVNEPGAFWGLLIGLVVGLTRMIMDFVYRAPNCGEEDTRPSVLKNVHYLYFAILLFGLTSVVCIVISLCTKAIPDEELGRMTWWTRKRSDQTTPIKCEMDLTKDVAVLPSTVPPIEKEPEGRLIPEIEIQDNGSVQGEKTRSDSKCTGCSINHSTLFTLPRPSVSQETKFCAFMTFFH
ncbi:hypothetical protein GDO81_016969 [Engystomops pustulosus]|uniref:Sodium/glucose cotransporter 4 n=1 Tax=Engystomops pustulosus TaxID=76066 RepID=A0AAV7AEP2_ENGPU|nr:hypothetical protein GDO81_016969 [Engystomops pustulosus]